MEYFNVALLHLLVGDFHADFFKKNEAKEKTYFVGCFTSKITLMIHYK